MNLELSALKAISEKEIENTAQKSFSEISKNDNSQDPPVSMRILKKPNEKGKEKVTEASLELKNEEDDMLDKALEQIEKENLPLTYEVIFYNKSYH